MANYILLLGSNIGDTRKNLSSARSITEDIIGEIIDASDIVETLPIGQGVHGVFSNQILIISTSKNPEALLDDIEHIEMQLGRNKVRNHTDWKKENRIFEDRIIDIDILYMDINGENKYEDLYSSERLEIPHRAISTRPFIKDLIQLLHTTTLPNLSHK